MQARNNSQHEGRHVDPVLAQIAAAVERAVAPPRGDHSHTPVWPVRPPPAWVFEDHGYRARYTENGTRAHIVAAWPDDNTTTVCGIEAHLGDAAEQGARVHAMPLCQRCMHEGLLWHPALRDRMKRRVTAWPS